MLTLPGIAGVILTIGMGVDSNVLVFERIREELRNGKAPASAVALGFDRAFLTIIDTHVTTIVSAIFLFLFGTGPVRGFAVTLRNRFACERIYVDLRFASDFRLSPGAHGAAGGAEYLTAFEGQFGGCGSQKLTGREQTRMVRCPIKTDRTRWNSFKGVNVDWMGKAKYFVAPFA